jgi:predicted Zn-dependent protease
LTVGQQTKGLLWLAGAALLALVFAAGLPFFAGLVPWSWERRAGDFLGEPGGNSCGKARPEAAAALEKTVRRLYPIYPADTFPLQVQVVSGREVNAYASLGGRVYVLDGLLRQAKSPDELAGVLAHELEHVRRRHIMQGFLTHLITTGALRAVAGEGLGKSMGTALMKLGFSRGQESQADEGGLRRLRDARVGVEGYARFFDRLESSAIVPALFSDHPSNQSRSELARRYAGGPVEPLLSGAEWKSLKSICGER